MIVLAYGGGTNSTALLVGMHERGERPDLSLFADTGGERPEVYRYIETVNEWCRSVGFPEIITVKKVTRDGNILTLEQNCLNEKMLPSIAYGFKSCSLKYKVAPQDKYCNSVPESKAIWKSGAKVTKLIGYDAGEERRAHIKEDDKYVYRYPLIEWDWGRDECVAAIARAGLPPAGKSACYFCPSSRPSEIKALQINHPDLLSRALAMEANAKENLTHIKGLGRNWSWTDFIAFNDAQLDMFRTDVDTPCGCYDGGGDE
jgi:hypothetical protein